MSRTSFTSVCLGVAAALTGWCLWAAESRPNTLVEPLQSLFRHSKHHEAFGKLKIRCADCHSFSIKPKEKGPVDARVPTGLLKPSPRICHECHLGKVSLPRPNQCVICHTSTEAIRPPDHLLGWETRHGRMAQLDRQSCAACHTPATCSKCHSRVDALNPIVHEPNFRLAHSIRARANPQSCVQCHKSPSFCKDCHAGGTL